MSDNPNEKIGTKWPYYDKKNRIQNSTRAKDLLSHDNLELLQAYEPICTA